ncbi:MAG: capsule assembly Wzi family protein [candidate division KSB1 bacterium]|nr:capsule assembly Wzi family protein [candidate division KSB1 bacterium]
MSVRQEEALRRLILVLSTSCMLFAPALTVVGQSVNVPMDHWAYRLLERLETKGLVRKMGLRAMPMSRAQVAELVAAADKAAQEDPSLLSRSERELLEQLKGELCDEPSIAALHVQPRYRERHLMRWQEGTSLAFVDALLALAVDGHRADTMQSGVRQWRAMGGGIVRGSLGGRLGFYVDARNTMTRGGTVPEESFDPQRGMPLVTSGRNVYSDQAEAYVILQTLGAQVQIGRMQAHWGPGWRGGLLLSRNAPLFDAFRLTLPFKRFSFTAIHAFLTRMGGPRYLAAHRLEIALADWLTLAGSESVLYGGRDVEFSYLNPLMPYHVAEHHLGDRDNNMLSFDMTAFPLAHIKVYGELLLDDMTLTKNPLRYYGNKFAFTIGGHWVSPPGLPEGVIRLEYTRVEPFVYTHYDSLNVYVHYDRIIGHWLGPDGDNVAMAAEYQWSRDIFTQLLVQWRRTGQGGLWKPYPEGGSERKSFLSGVVEHERSVAFQVIDQVRKDVFVSLTYTGGHLKNRAHVLGEAGYERRATISVAVNY